MTNPKVEYNTFIRANLPSGMTYDSTRNRYVVNNKYRFPTYLQAKWYLDYIIKFGFSAETPVFDPESGLTGGTDYAPETVFVTTVELDRSEPTVLAVTIPSDWGGAGSDGVVFNQGGGAGAACVIDGDGRVGAFTNSFFGINYALSDTGVLTGGERLVMEFDVPTENRPRIWVDGVQVTFDTAYNDTTSANWAGGDNGGYLDQSADGQVGAATAFPTSGTWSTMAAAPITAGTWGDITIYRNQTVGA